ncbi:hypothetical protein CEY12_12425 [Chryseobacterium sp. T16E-39]|uniref:hypothetical protein n=1 Tax=Chryseobacterium sp. T16E-39 TaxID=2015076 RepID=UPI000B5B3224|nr:hypothetical protein [Chryseobacterium sp. T16E-39]ASK30869.1 hypothetical protein CEY12_12425 [Chryseobacterium sp. T16E-39]
MMKIFVFMLCCGFVLNCQSQSQTVKIQDPQNEKDYFVGKWKFIGETYKDGEVNKEYPLKKCMKQYTLLFEKEKENMFFTKNFVSGENCEIKSSSRRNLLTIKGSSLQYMDGDLKESKQFKIISKNKFSIMYSDIMFGKVTDIEDIYERQ